MRPAASANSKQTEVTERKRSKAGGFDAPSNIKELFLHRLGILANIAARTAALQNRRKFGLSMLDWRIVGLVATMAPASLNQVAQAANLQKSQASRAVGKLIAGGLINRHADASDGRGIQLVLTAKGRALHRKVLPVAAARNAALLEVLSRSEREALDQMLRKLMKQARELLAAEVADANDKGSRQQGPG